MQEFWLYFEIGLKHVLNINAYDHILFLIGMTIPYSFNDWKKWLTLVSLFTLGHSISLILSVFGIIYIKENLVEFLIPITILIVALFNLFTAGKSSKKESITLIAIVTLLFGIIHGLGFSNYFKTLLPGSKSDKVLPLAEFALGIESAQIIVVFVVLIISFIIQSVFRFSKRDWTLVMSSFIIGVVTPLIIQSPIWHR
ncbi:MULTISPECIES: HupE/UreJ family protein [Flavobacterium]|uniref:HupE/UreJ family protein n=1 Tax=Flavobacterium covae TaxID=2906076 RepID=A0ABW8PEM0_9FLAO|nr:MULTISPECIES: HupE/UreJ family protein [Flavobacterium]OXA82807.1 HupE / UreJ protein [Flavobacterium columnare] [Flavobacterium columnare NBRC 100251 = ATCC 23463]AMA50225.1 HupE / UreJ protein [Flavobacterium covae]AND64256.1 HupE / UreJ protein [Flavobacterium covae]MCJ1807135.1 HupE/UreJ family protein [Flavobacterium covae]MCJ1809429.1 HupE/UreJ family protein [Flavobacterium covae]